MHDDASAQHPPATQRLGPLVLWTAITVAVAALVWITVGPNHGPNDLLTVEWTSEVSEILEGDMDVVLTVWLSVPARTDTEVPVRLVGARADDVVATPSVILIAAGQREGSVRLSLPDDTTQQGSSTLDIVLEPDDDVDAPDPVMTLVIIDDEDLVAPTTNPPTTAAVTTTLPAPTQDIAPTLLAKDSAEGASSITTPEMEFTQDRLVIVALTFLTRQRETPIPEVTGAGLDWEIVDTQTRQEGPRRLTVYRAMPTSSTSGSLEINLNQETELAHWIVLEVEGVATGGNGANAIVQVQGKSAGSFENKAAVRLQPFSSPTNATLAVFFAGVTGLESEPGYVEVAEQEFPLRTMAVYFMPGPDDIVETAQWGEGAHWLALAMELQAGAG